MAQTFFEQQHHIFSLFDQKKFDEALVEIHRAESDFPNRLEKTSYWKACVYARLGEKESAIQALNQALETVSLINSSTWISLLGLNVPSV